MSVVNEFINLGSAAGTAGGVLAGQALHELSEIGVIKNRKELVGAHKNIRPNHLARPNLFRRTLGRSAVHMAILGGIAGFAYGEMAAPAEHLPAKHAKLAVLVGHTETAWEDHALPLLDDAAEGFAHSHSVDAQILLEHNNNQTLDPVTVEEMNADTAPLGDNQLPTSIGQAMSAAYASAPQGNSNIPGTSEAARSDATVVLADGESPGDVAQINAIVTQSKHEGGQPIYIGSTKFSPDLQKLAEMTGGKYFPITKSNSTTVAGNMVAAVQPHEVPVPPNPIEDAILFAIGTATTAAMVSYGIRRYRQPEERDGRVN